MRILVVDDTKENQYLLKTMLEGSGYEMVAANNGKEALDKLRSLEIDIIISDILMPVAGKKCYQVYQQRESACPWCPSLKTLQSGETHTEIVPYPSEKNPTGRIELTTFPLKYEQGRVTRVIEYFKDITESKKMEKELDKEAGRKK